MWLSDLSIRRPVFITMGIIALSVVGVILYGRMAVDLFPDVSIPIVAVQTIYPGATPREIEEQITKSIEDAVVSLNHVEELSSTSAESASVVVIQFAMEYSTKEALDEVRQRVALLRNSLPDGAYDPVVMRFDPSAAPILSVAIADRQGQMTTDHLRALVADEVLPRLERVAGVGSIEMTGGRQREIHVDLNLERLRAVALPVQQVVNALKAENLNIPGGRLTEDGKEQLLRTTGQFSSLDEIGSAPLLTPLGTTLHVRDVATVEDSFTEQRSISRLNGRESVMIHVRKQSGTNTVHVADAVKEEMKGVSARYPDLEFANAYDQSTFTRESTDDVLASLVMGGALAAVVVFFFFRDIRNTVVTVAGLPVIVLGTFIAMYVAGFTTNMLTLMALSLSIGMLIDDAIVVRENIFRHMENGEEPKVAASRGTSEIALAVLATTLTIVAVFGPVGFVSGISGKFLREFGLTVAMAVLISLFEAFTLAPMLSAYFFKRRQRGERPGNNRSGAYGATERGYRTALAWSLRHRLVVVAIAILALGASAGLLPYVGRSFISDFDRGELKVNLEMPPGTPLADMDAMTRRVEDMLKAHSEVADVFAVVGSSSGEGATENSYVQVRLQKRGLLQDFQREIRSELESLKDVKFDIDLSANTLSGMIVLAGGGGSGMGGSVHLRPILLDIQGSDFDDLDTASQQVMETLRGVPGVVDVDRSLKTGRPELQVQVDRPRAAEMGISSGQIGATVRALVNGETASRYHGDGQEADILVRLRPEDRDRAEDILRLPLLSPKGAQVILASLARVVPATGPAQIQRLDRQHQILVGAGYSGRELGEVTDEVRTALDKLSLPAGVTVSFGGETKYMEEAFSNLIIALLLAVMFIYMVLASQFESFIHPFTIMLALPLSFLGALLALMVTGKNLDMVALIGVILLMGLVTKNSILLVDFTNRLRRGGADLREAVLTAGPIRLRPILMTTIAMIFGMLPIAFGYGAGAEVRMPMAIAVIGGLVTSTLLTLLVVPVVYTIVDDLGGLLFRSRREKLVLVEAGTGGSEQGGEDQA